MRADLFFLAFGFSLLLFEGGHASTTLRWRPVLSLFLPLFLLLFLLDDAV
jgi:hypothetical protein